MRNLALVSLSFAVLTAASVPALATCKSGCGMPTPPPVTTPTTGPVTSTSSSSAQAAAAASAQASAIAKGGSATATGGKGIGYGGAGGQGGQGGAGGLGGAGGSASSSATGGQGGSASAQGGRGGRATSSSGGNSQVTNVSQVQRADRLQAPAMGTVIVNSTAGCRNGVGFQVTGPGAGAGFGFTTRDLDCNVKEYYQLLQASGNSAAAMYLLSEIPEVNRAMRATGMYGADGRLLVQYQPRQRTVYRVRSVRKARDCGCR